MQTFYGRKKSDGQRLYCIPVSHTNLVTIGIIITNHYFFNPHSYWMWVLFFLIKQSKEIKMKLIKYILFLILLSISIIGNAQKFKSTLLAGLSTSQINGDLYQGFDKLGIYAGVSVSTDFNNVLGAKIELLYIGKGAKKNVGGVEEYKTKLHYVEMPFLFSIKPVDKFEFELGLAGSYLISSALYEHGAEVPDGLVDMYNFDLDGIASASYYFSGNIGINVRMEHSLIPIKNNPNWYNYNLSFGLVYKISKK